MVWTYNRAPLRSGWASYEKKIYPPTWDHQFYIVSVDTSSQYITNTITPLKVNGGTTVEYSSSMPTRLVVTEWETITNIDLTLADQWTNIVWWTITSEGASAPLVSWIPVIVSENMTFIPTVRHVVRYTMSFDTTSPHITNTITPFLINENSTASYQTATSNEMTFVEGWHIFSKTLEFSDGYWATWWAANNSPMTAWTSITIAGDTQFTPTVQLIHRDTQWPCPNGFHIGTKDEWNDLKAAMTVLWLRNKTDVMRYLMVPSAYYLARSNGTKETRYWVCRIWTSTMTANNVAWCMGIDQNDAMLLQEDKPGNGFSIRPFKDKPPKWNSSEWETMVKTQYGQMMYSLTLWLISIYALDPNTFKEYKIYISDKNLWATNVWDNWLFYQFWNNTWYTYNASPYVTSKPTLSDNYWPGNYYTGKFVRVSSGNNWFNWTCNNIWWWTTNWTWTEAV